MAFHALKIFTEQNIQDTLTMGHPYRPGSPLFLFIKKGRMVIKEQINTFELIENTIILVDSQSVYEILEVSSELEVRILIYQRSFISKIGLKFNRLNIYHNVRMELRKGYTFIDREFEVFWDILKSIDYFLDEVEELEYAVETIESLFSAFIYNVSSFVMRNRKNTKGMMTRNQEIVLDFIGLVGDNYLSQKSVEFYAQTMMLSTRHLSSVMKAETGKTAGQMINEFIINEAKALLASTLKPVNEISDRLNFSDQYSFSHFFKKHLGMSPTEYRNQF
ncbi:AraC family transcriptional regulator [Elizabethkingia meningoseptica]|uniref:AraC family transcriptional regulator n=1 Tax=Elizabethkingia meningoseptica TaxID=238 RepID=A0A1T3FFC9_ELIME|nr:MULTISPECIES: helix-turn-helix domain-containing protein [Elizabethkingia]AQX13229.1 AraC family transcriptional regulator [Elizabethkingia meningoseptica]MBG0514855.1 helix-turn-helix transcriptional regulator [Elizabethkingia meningoseptica]MDE5433691.1 AraC family transcriptional regulator [Elizabethkingia meningoseptica]MDE5470942.1 AraC family transcriptional regulator [Elizabethkingia meningoseptica]MDE5482291.1 AraC family transcriptional regulator [Elizabethkingia meningoseptica]